MYKYHRNQIVWIKAATNEKRKKNNWRNKIVSSKIFEVDQTNLTEKKNKMNNETEDFLGKMKGNESKIRYFTRKSFWCAVQSGTESTLDENPSCRRFYTRLSDSKMQRSLGGSNDFGVNTRCYCERINLVGVVCLSLFLTVCVRVARHPWMCVCCVYAFTSAVDTRWAMRPSKRGEFVIARTTKYDRFVRLFAWFRFDSMRSIWWNHSHKESKFIFKFQPIEPISLWIVIQFCI